MLIKNFIKKISFLKNDILFDDNMYKYSGCHTKQEDKKNNSAILFTTKLTKFTKAKNRRQINREQDI